MFHVCDLECKEYKTENHPIPGRWQLGDMQFDRCPRTYITENVSDWITAYQMYKNGFLPSGTGWLCQAFKYIKVIVFLDNQIELHKQEVAVSNARK